jgi:chromosome segregation ATPase
MSGSTISGGLTGGGNLSVSTMALQVQRSNADAQVAASKDEGKEFESIAKQMESKRKDVRREEKDVQVESEKLDEHIERGPEFWDKFNPLTKGSIHEKQTEAQNGAIDRESADVAREEIALKEAKKELSESLQSIRANVEASNTSFKDTTSALEETQDVSELLLGKIKA